MEIPGGADAERDMQYQPRVGDRVRVRAGVAHQSDPDGLPHFPDEEQQVGTIAAVHTLTSAPHHVYLVQLDPPHPIVWMGPVPFELSYRHYAADELEAVE